MLAGIVAFVAIYQCCGAGRLIAIVAVVAYALSG